MVDPGGGGIFKKKVPFGNANPDAGVHDEVTPGQLSVAVSVNVVTAVHCPGSVFFVIGAGHVIFGGSLSFTVTVKLQESVLPEASVAVQWTVVVPFGNAN